MYNIKVITDAATEPLTTAEAKQWCNIDSTADDTLVSNLITAARRRVEDDTCLTLVSKTLEMTIDKWPENNYNSIEVAYGPVQSITSIYYIDTAGVSTLLGSSNYQTDLRSTRARIRPAFGYTWPSVREDYNSIVIRYVAGFGAASVVPQQLKHAILFLVGTWYENRESVVIGTSAGAVPFTYDMLINGYRDFI